LDRFRRLKNEKLESKEKGFGVKALRS